MKTIAMRLRTSGLLTAAACALASGQVSYPSLPVLSSVEQVRTLAPDEARRGYPVHLQVVVTYFDKVAPNLFVQDSTGAMWVDWPPNGQEAEPGQLIDLQGITAQPDFAPDIARPVWRVLRQAPLPKAQRASMEEMASTSIDSKRVEVEGIVRSAEQIPGDNRLHLALDVPGGRVMVHLAKHRVVTEGLVDSRVRVRGACGAIFNKENQLVGVALFVPSLADVSVIETGPADAFALPVRRIAGLQKFTVKGLRPHRVKVLGVVLAQFLGRNFYISDDSGNLYVETSQTRMAASRRSGRSGRFRRILQLPRNTPGRYLPIQRIGFAAHSPDDSDQRDSRRPVRLGADHVGGPPDGFFCAPPREAADFESGKNGV